MRINAAVAAAVAAFGLHLAGAVPAPADNQTAADPPLRLIKTSEDDPGKLVTEKEMSRLTSEGIGFMDVTDVTQNTNSTLVARQGVRYPGRVRHVDEANELIRDIKMKEPERWLETLTNFYTRYFNSPSGIEAAAWLYNEAIEVASANGDITVTRFRHEWEQPSIIVQIPGKSRNLVILGAHFDCTAGGPDIRSPGADDNGSGVVVVLETLRVLAKAGFVPENTIEFHFYAAEEVGLRGSMDIFRHYAEEGKRVIAMLNQDMEGRSANVLASVVTDYVYAPLAEYMYVLASHYLGRPPSRTKCGYACSDHASAYQYSFPAVLVIEDTFESASRERDTSDDTLDKVEGATLYRHTKLAIGYVVEASYVRGD
ncbi:peptidase family M28 domain-containing protein [Hirsutella rhossiliensis]|uniref:Peptide hydrolase n=1 Tax=Hirsutella rhossiliensis TaxID=111463 RepID=A0A9P8MRT3_9HYPO|nr:peptidase family m28 domain-containing protein [Hirsutella rhossiliensis]KAH0961063.1 peptidase family m28 domain-containing protein [Hirsutella rhossiliensis]